MNVCLLIPCFDHGASLHEVLDGASGLRLPCIVVDDGSGPETQALLRELVKRFPWLRVERRDRNGGKGAALKTGYRLAASLGYSHALQVDADGQHDSGALPRLLEAARAAPEALILGAPVLEGAPAIRRYGRVISRVWAWIETCSLEIRDPLCGLRCIPLAATLRVLERVRCGDHMDFDPELAVRLVWQGVPVINVAARVRYPEGGVSHFDVWRDNVRISWLHARLFCGMLVRAPRLVRRRWSRRRELPPGQGAAP